MNAVAKDPGTLLARVEAFVLKLRKPQTYRQITFAFPSDPYKSVQASISNLASHGKITRYHHGSGLMHYGPKGLAWGDAEQDASTGVVMARAYAAPVQPAPVRVLEPGTVVAAHAGPVPFTAAPATRATGPSDPQPLASAVHRAMTPSHTHPGTAPPRSIATSTPRPTAQTGAPVAPTQSVEPPMSRPPHSLADLNVADTDSDTAARERDALRALMTSIITHMHAIPEPVREAMHDGLDVLGGA